MFRRSPVAPLVTLVALLIEGLSAAQAHAAVDLESGLQSLASTLAGQMRGKGVQKLAVVDFSDIRGYPSALDAYLAEELITQLFAAAPGELTIVERRQLARVLEEQKLTSSAVFDQAAVAEIGRVLGIDAIVTGSIADLGDAVKVNARAISVETGGVFASAGAELAKAGRVAELLRQTAGPERAPLGGSGEAPPSRQVQASDVFFESKLVRVTVASVGVSEDRRTATVAFQVENVSGADLDLAIDMKDSMGNCAAGLTDERGGVALASRLKVTGISCVYSSQLERKGGWATLSPRSRTTLVMPFRRSERGELGRIFAVGIELVYRQGGRGGRISVGLSNIVSPG